VDGEAKIIGDLGLRGWFNQGRAKRAVLPKA